MNLTHLVCTVEQARELSRLGIHAESALVYPGVLDQFEWERMNDGSRNQVCTRYYAYSGYSSWFYRASAPALTAQELLIGIGVQAAGEWFNESHTFNERGFYILATNPIILADRLLVMLGKGTITATDFNQRYMGFYRTTEIVNQ